MFFVVVLCVGGVDYCFGGWEVDVVMGVLYYGFDIVVVMMVKV